MQTVWDRAYVDAWRVFSSVPFVVAVVGLDAIAAFLVLRSSSSGTTPRVAAALVLTPFVLVE